MITLTEYENDILIERQELAPVSKINTSKKRRGGGKRNKVTKFSKDSLKRMKLHTNRY